MLWTELIDPATLTGYARASLADYEERKGTLARWLPYREVPDIVARFVAGQTGLVDVAKFRAFDAEPEVGKRQAGKRVTIELPALGQNIPVSEYEQLRVRGGSVSDQQALKTVLSATDIVVRAISDGLERMRGIVLNTGKATISQDNYATEDDFGRPAGHTVSAAPLWGTAGTEDALGDLESWSDTYRDATGEDPGAIVMSTRVLRVLAGLDQMKTQLLNSASRPATAQNVRDYVTAAGLPPIYLYDRRVSVDGSSGKVVPDDRVMLLPAPVDVNDWQGTDLGATFLGRTLTSTAANFSLEESDQPGVVVGVYRNEKPPQGTEVISDAIGLPVLANAERSFVADVLA